MKISSIRVGGLFDRFVHQLDFDTDERITIMFGPNGFGKTMILRILDRLFNFPVRRLQQLPFQEVDVFFDNATAIKVKRPPYKGSRMQLDLSENQGLILEYFEAHRLVDHINLGASIREEDFSFLRNSIDEFIPHLDRVGPSEWYDPDLDEVLKLQDAVEHYIDVLPPSLWGAEEPPHIPSWLSDIRRSIPVRFIGTERLTRSTTPRRNRSPFSFRTNMAYSAERTVRHYSDELARMVQQKLTEYGTLSQSLDRTFPARLVEEPSLPTPSMSVLETQLEEVESKRASIVEAGLLVEEHEDLTVFPLKVVDESRRDVLAVYAKDALQKLSVFDDLYARVDTLKRIANSRFLHKKLTVSQAGLKVSSMDGTELDLEMLSSGEQHEIVILYDLMFGVTPNSLIMIDEPELSLHVAWQRQLLNDFQEMANLSDFHVLLATHSPQIIGDRWDLTCELKAPDPA